MKEYYLVPKEDIDAVEQARKAIHNKDAAYSMFDQITLINMLRPLWMLTHKKYPKVMMEEK